MYICIDCKNQFDNSTVQHDLYDEPEGCPECGGGFIELIECCLCGKPIVEDCIKDVDGYKCNNCYTEVSLENLLDKVYRNKEVEPRGFNINSVY